MEVDWYHCKGGFWCELNKIDLNHPHLDDISGVYIIWCGTSERSVLRIGAGNIRAELYKNRFDIAIQAFTRLGIYVTWAEVPPDKRNGVEYYLIKELIPKFTKLPAKQGAVKVNLPW